MTWNLLRQEWARPAWPVWAERVGPIASMVRKAAPDVLAIQEETGGMVEDLLLRLEGYRYLAVPPTPQSGSGLLLRRDRTRVLDRTRVALPFDRAVTALRLEVEGRTFWAASTHFTPFAERLEARTRSAEALADWAEGLEEPLVVMGDFNSLPADPAMNLLLRREFRDALSPDGGILAGVHTAVETPGSGAGIRLDYLLLRGDWTVRHAARLEPDPRASDHFPLVADLD